MRNPAWTFSKVTSYTFSPTEYGWPIVCSINRAVSPISISEKVTPSARASLIALFLVCSPVANPGNANARMSLRGRPSRSMAWVATISACVESNPPDTPITTFG
ncbi:Uncharacterised protein [Mycobacterium tuberculosis]|uniref:Uncharacterized protein n=1 Tax=Mycobacterium tuberculosis TaxID=1773 RepID=A0A655FH03_MYCTX|nr:Uncharacterised protein [Mycobacterium tuberculosis]CKS14175.1 Uncharacterised protein [Mycobacterium tuberculosis]CNG46389.1 Uncharacterised protein [Mycobacterium tuberculosis]CNV53666.1 Uncharacterised protein [Mycobacterium tuberculosis]CNV71165.1 Uncharacterised protein [Mycobacterium tuberculosis]